MLKILAIVPCPSVFGLQIMTLRFFERLSGKVKSHFLLSHWTDGDFSCRLDQLAVPYSYSWLGMISRKLDRDNLDMTIAALKKLPILYRDFRNLIRSFRPDVIYLGGHHEVILLWPVLMRSRIPVVFHVHNPLPIGPFYRSSFLFWRLAVDHYIGVSESIQSSISNLGVEAKRISLLYNGIDVSEFQYVQERSVCFAERYGWPNGATVIGMTGQMSEIKGHLDLVDAARVIYKTHPEVRFVIGGKQEGSYFQRLQEYILATELRQIVAFSGWQDDMTSFYEGLDIFVFPSRCDEAFGLVVAEAMAMGLPVIATRSGGAGEVVEDGKTGILVERQNPEELAKATSLLVASPERRLTMGRAGRRRIEQYFDLSRQAARLQTILEGVARSGKSKRRQLRLDGSPDG